MAKTHHLKDELKTHLDPILVRKIVKSALLEDLGSGDITSDAISSDETTSAVILAKAPGVIAGLPIAEQVFHQVDSEIEFRAKICDGAQITPGDEIAEIKGKTGSILKAERTALNFFQRMSGIATATKKYVEAVAGFNVTILDTRKTAPGLRILDKYAVRAGGGSNHRMGLYDGALIKDNHIRAAGSVREAVEHVRNKIPLTIKIEIETTTLAEVEEALAAGAEIIMLDNMPIVEMKKAVKLIAGRALVEASGGVTLENVREVAATGVDFISVGALTHSVKALDLSLEMR